MKHLIIAAALAAVTAASAAELTVKPYKPWNTVAPGEYSLDYDGSQSWPTVKLDVKDMKPETYYRLSVECRTAGKVAPQLCGHDSRDGKKISRYVTLKGGKEEFAPLAIYFKTGDLKNFDLFINLNPGAAGKVELRNIKLEEVADFSGNLLAGGDFEKGCGFEPDFTADDGVRIVSDAGFLSGKKSLKIVKPADKGAGVSSNPLPVLPGKTAVVKFWAKSGNGTLNAYVIFDCFQGEQNRHLYKEIIFKLEPEWKEYSFEFAVPADVNEYTGLKEGTCRLRLGLRTSSETAEGFFDNVEYCVK